MNTCVETKRTSNYLQILHPAAFFSKEEGFLATHPLSCHPRRVFNFLENERKLEKVREKEKRRELPKGWRPKILLK